MKRKKRQPWILRSILCAYGINNKTGRKNFRQQSHRPFRKCCSLYPENLRKPGRKHSLPIHFKPVITSKQKNIQHKFLTLKFGSAQHLQQLRPIKILPHSRALYKENNIPAATGHNVSPLSVSSTPPCVIGEGKHDMLASTWKQKDCPAERAGEVRIGDYETD